MNEFYLLWMIVSIAIFLIIGAFTLLKNCDDGEKPQKVFVIIIVVSFVIALFMSWKACGGV